MNHSTVDNDQRIDRLLQALATTPAPAGLEQRVAQRVAQRISARLEQRAIDSRVSRVWIFGPGWGRDKLRAAIASQKNLRPYAIGAAALTALAVLCLLLFAHTEPQRQFAARQRPTVLPQPKAAPPSALTQASSAIGGTHSPQRTSVAAPLPSSAAQDDSDNIALAETLAPSRPTPQMPLTAQEALLLRSTRRGQPIEVAELDTLRESALSSLAAARERSSLRQTLRSLLGPLATAQALSPSAPSPQPDDSQPASDAEPPSSR